MLARMVGGCLMAGGLGPGLIAAAVTLRTERFGCCDGLAVAAAGLMFVGGVVLTASAESDVRDEPW